MKFGVNEKCPCGSKEKYKKCCQVFHKGKIASNALELMKSRYSAYACGDIKYIINTTHKENSDYTNDFDQWAKEIEIFCKKTDFIKLEILEYTLKERESFVKFKAHLEIDGEDQSFVELSRFVKVDNRWYYHSAKID